MIIGADTGFFIEMSRDNPRALQIGDNVEQRVDHLVISVLTVAEYFAHHIPRGTLGKAQALVQRMQRAPNISFVPISLDIAARSARYRTGLQMATVDSMILTTFLESRCDLILTTDSDIAKPQVQSLVKVELLT